MGTLLLRLAAPMQAWGDESKYEIRGTRREPTKSGVIGLVAAAMGLSRDDSKIRELAEQTRFGVRVDQPGTMIRDFHTVKPPKYRKDGSVVYNTDGGIRIGTSPYVTNRYYLCDAVFLVGIESDNETLLDEMCEAVRAPVYPIFLGRRSCPPTLPVCMGIRDVDMEGALENEPWVAAEWFQEKKSGIRARIITEAKAGERARYMLMDQPVSFSPIHRKYDLRSVKSEKQKLLGKPEHDPMAALEED